MASCSGPGAPPPIGPFVPFIRPADGWPAGPTFPSIPVLALRAAVTSQGTMLSEFNRDTLLPATSPRHRAPPADYDAAIRGACFDNIFFGGDVLPAAAQFPLGGNDAGSIYNIAGQIVQNAAVTPQNISVAAEHAAHLLEGTRDAASAPNLAAGAAAVALTNNDRLIGTRFISDHLPVIVQFNLP